MKIKYDVYAHLEGEVEVKISRKKYSQLKKTGLLLFFLEDKLRENGTLPAETVGIATETDDMCDGEIEIVEEEHVNV